MEDNSVITLYKNKVQEVPTLILGIILLIFVIGIFIIIEPVTAKSKLIPMAMFFVIFSVYLIGIFLNENRKNKNRLYIKENGNVYSGNVFRIDEFLYREKLTRRLVIEFFEGNEKKLILSEHFPYYIYLNKKDMYDEMEFMDMEGEEYNKWYNENVFKQYYGHGYISFEKTKLTNEIYEYVKNDEKNYLGNIKCNVYEYEGKYVIDDIEGYSKKEQKKNKYKMINRSEV